MIQSPDITPSSLPPTGKAPILPIYNITPFTMLDFPDKTACIIWFTGCNMRCGYCHNPQIVKGKGKHSLEKLMQFLKKRQGLLDGVVLSGGEASSYPDIMPLIKEIKSMGYEIKLDTNGLKPGHVQQLCDDGLIDYIALDYKAPPEKFKKVTGVEKYKDFEQTLKILTSQSKIPFEVRTTVHTDLLDENDINHIIDDLNTRNYTGTYYIQNFLNDNDRPTLGNLPSQTKPFKTEKLIEPNNYAIEMRNF